MIYRAVKDILKEEDTPVDRIKDESTRFPGNKKKDLKCDEER